MTHRILIADDEPNILISLEYLMKREGYDGAPWPATAGGAGRAAARAPDLVLLDVMMPRKTASRSARKCARTRPCRTPWS
jgi:DNA-binding response OmpR family regulator